MDPLELSILKTWNSLSPTLTPADLKHRLSRRHSQLLQQPPRPWCLALRASDTRLLPHCTAHPDRHHFHEVILTRESIVELCSLIDLPPRSDLAQTAALLGCSTNALLSARVAKTFRTDYFHHPWGKPRPLLSCDHPLDPAAPNFLPPHALWTWTATYLTNRLPENLPDQLLTRVPAYRHMGHFYLDPATTHPEHPDLVPPEKQLRKSKVLPPPPPDNVWYKWKGTEYIGYDWRNPRAAAAFHRREQRLQKARASAKARRRDNPPPRSSQGSIHYIGHNFLCPKCGKKSRLLYLPLPRINLLRDEFRRMKDEAKDPGIASILSSFIPHPSSFDSFACSHCHNLKRISFAHPSSAWNEIITYLTGGLLYGHEVPKPFSGVVASATTNPPNSFDIRTSDFGFEEPKRRNRPHRKITRPPSRRRQQIESLMLHGLSIKEICIELRLKPGTILFYSTQIYEKHNIRCLRDLLLKHHLPLRPGMRGPAKGKRGEGRQPRTKPPKGLQKSQISNLKSTSARPALDLAASLYWSLKS
jgi:hypothetical protein